MSELTKLTDEELMKAYQLGNEMAFEILYERYSRKVYGFLMRKLHDRAAVDDVFQGTFMKLHQSRSNYDSTFPFAPWLFTVCRSMLVDAVRKKKRIQEELNPLAIGKAVSIETAPFETLSLSNLSLLPTVQRKAIELRYGNDLPFDEIARRLDTTPTNVRQLISRAIKKLKSFARGGTK